jgi:hypothetical protein
MILDLRPAVLEVLPSPEGVRLLRDMREIQPEPPRAAELVDAEEAARLLGMTPAAVRQAARRRTLNPVHLGRPREVPEGRAPPVDRRPWFSTVTRLADRTAPPRNRQRCLGRFSPWPDRNGKYVHAVSREVANRRRRMADVRATWPATSLASCQDIMPTWIRLAGARNSAKRAAGVLRDPGSRLVAATGPLAVEDDRTSADPSLLRSIQDR